jgi:hypothetical protein
MKTVLRLLGIMIRLFAALAMIGMAMFYAYGFLESFELPRSDRLLWQAGYGALGLLCLGLATFTLRSLRFLLWPFSRSRHLHDAIKPD